MKLSALPRRIAIIGCGPTGLYTLASLVEGGEPLSITVFEKNSKAGAGMPYAGDCNNRLMLANIASIELPPIGETFLDWVQRQPEEKLRAFGVDKEKVEERSFLPRLLLGEYFADRLAWLIDRGRERGLTIELHEDCEVTDLDPHDDAVWVSAKCLDGPFPFDLAVVATGHVWPEAAESGPSFFPSPWSGLIEAEIPAVSVGILGTSLSAIDAAMAVSAQHGTFVRCEDGSLDFVRDPDSVSLSITMMSRSGVLPEADFYCPIPYEPLAIATAEAISREIEAGTAGLLDRVFDLMRDEIALADPEWSARIDLSQRRADDFADAYFADRKVHDPFAWAEYNLAVVERNKAEGRTVAWRYTILGLHEVVEKVVSHLDDHDRQRFDAGLRNVFVDNYAAIPCESIRRLLALRAAGVIDVAETGDDYDLQIEETRTVLTVGRNRHVYEVFIDARGQRPLATGDLPFPSLRRLMLDAGAENPEVGDDFMLLAPESARNRIAFGALPYLIQDNPFIQGITASAEIGKAIGGGCRTRNDRARRRMPMIMP